MASVFSAFDAALKDPFVTVKQLLLASSDVLYPDSSMISYSAIANLDSGIGRLFEDDISVAVVGAGAAGIACTYELLKLVRNGTTRLKVTLIDGDLENVVFAHQLPERAGNISRAGRVYAESVTTTDDPYIHNYEVGAMRFPGTACLTWNYVSQLVDNTTTVRLFPNPGTVPTQFVLNDEEVIFMRDQWSKGPTANLVRKGVGMIYDRMFGSRTNNVESIFSIARFSPEYVKTLLTETPRSDDDLESFRVGWSDFILKYDKYSLRLALAETIEDLIDQLEESQDVSGYCNDTILNQLTPLHYDRGPVIRRNKIRYYMDIIAGFGFGTGGFGSIFDTSFVDFMRLYVWGYNNEYYLPFETNAHFLSTLYEKCYELCVPNNSSVLTVCATVLSVKRTAEDYVVYAKKHNGETTSESYNYVLITVPPSDLSKITNNISDDYTTADAKYCYDVLSFAADHMVMLSSSKSFGLVETNALKIEKPHLVYSGRGFDEPNVVRIEAVLSCDGLGSSYKLRNTKESKYTPVLFSYNWSDDSCKLQFTNETYPLSSNGDQLVEALRYRNGNRRWLTDSLASADCIFNFDWTATRNTGAFKLDKPVQEFYSNFFNKFYRLAVYENIDVLIAGDTYSHHGGWIEGAFITAINAVAGLVVASGRRSKPFTPAEDLLNGEAKKLFRSY